MILSVISIAYNNKEGLKKTLSLFEDKKFQSELELIVVDGGSKDGTSEYLRECDFIQKWVSEPDKGIYNAMNKGLNMATGDYVWFLNSGDYAINEEAIRQLIAILKTGVDAVYAETMMVDQAGNHLGTRSELSTRKLPDSLSWKSFKLGMNVGHQSFVIKRALSLPYNEQYRYVADIDWMIRSLKLCHRVVKMEGILACFTLDGFSSANRGKSNRERYQILKKQYGFWSNLGSHFYIILRKLANKRRI